MTEHSSLPAPPEVTGGRRWFADAAQQVTSWAGTGAAALSVASASLVWVGVGWAAGFPRWWELMVTAGVPFLTLLMLVVIQHTQNHDDRSVQVKLDEILRALPLDGAPRHAGGGER